MLVYGPVFQSPSRVFCALLIVFIFFFSLLPDYMASWLILFLLSVLVQASGLVSLSVLVSLDSCCSVPSSFRTVSLQCLGIWSRLPVSIPCFLIFFSFFSALSSTLPPLVYWLLGYSNYCALSLDGAPVYFISSRSYYPLVLLYFTDCKL